MIEQTKKALLVKAEKIAKESGDTMQSTMFMNGADWYRNHIWHDISEEADLSKFILLYDEKDGIFRLARRYPWLDWSGYVEAMNSKYDVHYTKWVYMEDILPNKKG